MGKRQSLCLCDAWGQTRAPRSDHVDLSFLASPPPHSSIPSHPIPSHPMLLLLPSLLLWRSCGGRGRCEGTSQSQLCSSDALRGELSPLEPIIIQAKGWHEM
ncbi:hypothetical protein OPV22_011064 [Ensete ventricosum]|uniref:Uncharacterized protein n=1 Tax=Ensete ventricosum TaxID=4639 RepID=A0AAV8RH10_ENSVE|nr:hypothetical protein OPV22_011064 [Ensete ventricosum]